MLSSIGNSRRSRTLIAKRLFSVSSRNRQVRSNNDQRDNILKILSCAGVISSMGGFYFYNAKNQKINSDVGVGRNQSPMGQPSMMATSASAPNATPQISFKLDDSADPSEEADFIVIGHGAAGMAAVSSLREKCPQATIMIVDPHPIPSRDLVDNSRTNNIEPTHVTGSAIAFNHSNQTIDVITSRNNVVGMKRLKYKHSVLIASGVRGAPPPESLIDERASERILELRSTQVPAFNQYLSSQSLSLADQKSELAERKIFPILPMQSVRQIALMAASQGAKICILGSDLEAVELAIGVASYRNEKKMKSNVCLMFGGSAPLNAMLPKYLSSAVSKRLKAHGIEVADRSLLRYVSSIENSSKKDGGNIEIHMVKSFDTMDTKRYQAELVIVAPRVRGQQGVASIPVPNGNRQSLLFNTWSKLCPDDQHVISCYSDDGRIVVNSELNAASNMFAAGSVAKYPNHKTGHATVAGEGVPDGAKAGRIAAQNMSKTYHERQHSKPSYRLTSSNIYSKNESLPITRTDHLPTTINGGSSNSSLASLGIHALCVGQCDSEVLSTHGFWWTNQSRRLTRRRSNIPNADGGRSQKAVYGSGVVYYLDRAGAIRGIMIWGLPFTKSSKSETLNEGLLGRIKNVIHSNGGVPQRDHKEAIAQMRLDTSVLSPSHLAEESRVLASLAFNASSEVTVRKRMPRPLHRFVPSKPITVTRMGILKKNKKIGNGGVGEDIFEHSGHALGEKSRHPSLVHYFSYDWNSIQPTPLDGSHGDDTFDEDEGSDYSYAPVSKQAADFAARPPKEEPLWMRKDEAMKAQSMNDRLAEMFMQNIMQGNFSDGSDAVKQAPVPQSYTDAKEWMRGGKDDGTNENEQ